MKELTVISGKGGTGKTSVVASFAALAHSKGLADGDVDAADLHLILAPEIKHEEDFKGGRTATIDLDACIDCGECINACPNNAIIPLTDPFGELSKFKHTVAIPSPALYAQFGREILPDKILEGLKGLGFDDALDLAPICGEVSFVIQEYIREYKGPKPLISITCPTVVRLIQVKYPDLTDLILPIDTPREIASREIKKKKSKELGLKEKEIGTFYLTPCPGKMISIRQPAEKGKSHRPMRSLH